MKYIHFCCVAITLFLSKQLQATTVAWGGASGTDTNWSNPANWSGATVPGGSDDVKFFDAGLVTFPSTNNVVDANLTIGSWQYGNTNNSHTTLIANGVTLTITNTGGLIVATPGDIGVARFLTNTITGAQGNLIVTNPSAVLSVSQGGAAGSSSEILNMTKLSTFTASINRIGVGTTTSYNPGNANNKLAGALYLAQTNFITLSLTDTLANYQASGTRTNSIELSRNPNNNGAVASYLYLGQSNLIFLDSIEIGMGKNNNTSYGWMGFNPTFTNNNPIAYFRGVSGSSSRVTWWCIGDGANVGSSSNGGVGTNDFSNGTVDALINVLSLGRDASVVDTFGGPHRGALTFTAGTIDVNTAIIGNQSLETGASTTPCLGVVNMGSQAILRVNTVMTLGSTTLATAAGTGTSGNLNVNGGTVYANTIAVGASSSANNIRLANAILMVTNNIATNATGLLNFATTNSILGLTVTANASLRGLTKNLLTGGATNLIALDSKPVLFVSYPQQFPLIKYTIWTGLNNFGLTNVPAWAVGATLVSNGPNSSLDLSLPTDPRPVFTAQPSPYSGSPGDNVTTSLAVTIAAGSITPLGYQWYYVVGGVTNQLSDGAGPSSSSTLSGATTANLQIANAQAGDSGNYFVVVTNVYGTNSSSQVLLTISAEAIAPAVTGPATLTATNSISTVIANSASGSPVPLLYWQYNGNPLANGPGPSGSSTISGTGSATLTISNPQYPGDQGTYSLIASNSAGLATNNTVLTVIVPPSISAQPANLVVINSQSASFTVTASGVPSPTYQWYKNNLGSPISGASNPSATNATFTIASTSPSDIANYFVVVQNAAGSMTSSNAALIVNSTMGYTSLKPGNSATGICYDTPLYITFTATPTLRAAGKIKIFNANNTVTPVDTIDLGLCMTNHPTYAVNVQAYSIGGDTFTNFPVMISGTTAAIYPHQGLLTSNQTYYVTLDDGTFTDSVGAYFAGITDTNAWRFTTKPTGPANTTNLVVAQDYSGDFATLQGAVNSVANNSTTPTFINLRNGTYTELINIKSRNNLDIRGQSRSGTIIGYPNNNNVYGGAPQRAAFVLNANDCTLENLTLTNMTVAGGGQAEAVDVEGTRAIFYNMDLDSRQDTFLVHSAGKLVYFQDCLIQGDTDFNWGYGTVYYTNCEIRCLSPGGHVTQPRSPYTTNGFAFVNCRITKGYSGSSTFDLGRTITTPLIAPSEVLFANCLMDDVVSGYASDAGTNMSDYACSNLTATATKTLTFSTHLTSSDPYVIAAQSAVTWLYGWQPQVAPNILSQPSNQSIVYGSNATFNVVVTGITAPTYQWLRNGTNLSGATNSTLITTGTVSDSGDHYSVIVTTPVGSVTSSNGTLTVSPANTSVGASSSVNPSGYKDAVSFLATLPADASGNVVFLSDNGAFSTNALSSGNATSLSITNLPRGTNAITIAYPGDVNYFGSTNTLNQIMTNHPPVANNVIYIRNAAVNSLSIPVSSLLTNATDVDGDALSLASTSISTNGSTVSMNGGYVLYSNTNVVSDQFIYSVTDGYGGTNSALVNITIDHTPLFGQSSVLTTGISTATLNFAGIPDYNYSVSRSTNLTSWTVIWTTNAPESGVFEFSDPSAPAAAAYYRLQYNP